MYIYILEFSSLGTNIIQESRFFASCVYVCVKLNIPPTLSSLLWVIDKAAPVAD